MATKTTKRFTGWVNDYGHSVDAHDTRENAMQARYTLKGAPGRTLRVVELRRGDVVLSREEADALRALADRVDRSIPLKWGKSPPDAKCFKCRGTGKYTWEDGHNGDEHESACDCTIPAVLTSGQALCDCTIPVVLTSGQALARFRGNR